MGKRIESFRTMRSSRYYNVIRFSAVYCLILLIIAFFLEAPQSVLSGLRAIVLTEDSLITDYIKLGGIGAAFVNSALVTLFSLCVLVFSGDPINGFSIVTIGLMSGFSLFGKNLFNITPIVLGTCLYSRYRKEPFSKYATVSLLSTSLAPVISFVMLTGTVLGVAVGLVLGLLIGAVLPSLSGYTYRIQNGMNLYNMGFACGLVAMILVPVMDSVGHTPSLAFYWSVDHKRTNGLCISILCVSLILAGLFFCKVKPREALHKYKDLLKSSGRAPSDFLLQYGAAPVLINMGINGLIGTLYILLIGGDLNGPTLGGILTIIGFSAYGKHARNITPIMLGVALGGFTMRWNLSDPSVQLAGLFCTTLAPISGVFGWPFGILAGFLHSSVVLHTGTPVEGINLYNNGFAGGLVAIVLYPVLMSIVRRKKPKLQDKEYYDIFSTEAPPDKPEDK